MIIYYLIIILEIQHFKNINESIMDEIINKYTPAEH